MNPLEQAGRFPPPISRKLASACPQLTQIAIQNGKSASIQNGRLASQGVSI
jgi:hypothetical protein